MHLLNKDSEINFFFAICGLPLVLAITLYSGEIWLLFNEADLSFMICLLFSGLMGITITCASLMVCTLCTPVTFNITGIFISTSYFHKGNLKDIGLTYLGFLFFQDTLLTTMVAIGLFLSFAGSGSYALDSYFKEKAKN